MEEKHVNNTSLFTHKFLILFIIVASSYEHELCVIRLIKPPVSLFELSGTN